MQVGCWIRLQKQTCWHSAAFRYEHRVKLDVEAMAMAIRDLTEFEDRSKATSSR